MSHPTFKRIVASIGIIVSFIVLALSAAGIIGAWVARQEVTSAALDALQAIDKASTSARAGLVRVDGWVSRVREPVQAVQTATAQLSQNVADKGVVTVLLPPRMEQELGATVQGVVDTLAAVSETVSSLRDARNAIDRLPFVDLPDLSAGPLAPVVKVAQDLIAGVQALSAKIADFRSGTSGTVQDVSDAAGVVDQMLGSVQTGLNEMDAQLGALQEKSSQLQAQLPTTLTWVAIGLTLFFAWVALSQVLVIRQAWGALKKNTTVA